MLVQRGRLQLDRPLLQWLRAAADPHLVSVVPITAEIAEQVRLLPETFQGDPADRLIAATAIAFNSPLLTHDPRIIDAHVVPLWRAARK